MLNLKWFDKTTLDKCRLLFNEIQNTLIVGETGCGKKTMIRYILGELYEFANVKTHVHSTELKINSNTYEFHMRISNIHYEIDITDLRGNDRNILIYLLNELKDKTTGSILPWKVIIINHANMISNDTWMALRKYMETNIDTVRLIFLSNTFSAIPGPIRSRVSVLAIPQIPVDRIIEMAKIYHKYGIVGYTEADIRERHLEWGGNIHYWYEYMTSGNTKYLYPIPISKIAKGLTAFIETGKLAAWNEIRKDLIKYVSIGINLDDISRTLIRTLSTRGISSSEKMGEILECYMSAKLLGQGLDKDILAFEYFIIQLKVMMAASG